MTTLTSILSLQKEGEEVWRKIRPFSCSVGERKIMNHFVVNRNFAPVTFFAANLLRLRLFHTGKFSLNKRTWNLERLGPSVTYPEVPAKSNCDSELLRSPSFSNQSELISNRVDDFRAGML
jgi:hypothetical protein